MDAGDGVDNDCDGKIDEEIKDGKDNDGDGEVDEDLELVSANCASASDNEYFTCEETENAVISFSDLNSSELVTEGIGWGLEHRGEGEAGN